MIDLNESSGPKSALAQHRRLITADLTEHVEAIARHALGEPNRQLSTHDQWRYGTNGSLAIEIDGDKKGAWFDHERVVGGGDPWSLLTEHAGYSPERARDALTELGIRDARQKARIVATYDYHDPHGRLAYQVVRFVPKTFKQRRPDTSDPSGWTWKVKGQPLYPYRLPEILAAPAAATVFVCEGEKDCDNLARLGVAATTNPGGAGKWPPGFAQWLAGRPIAILPDNDGTGASHAAAVAATLTAVCPAVHVLELPGLPPKGDASDWITAGGTLEALQALVAACPAWAPLNGHHATVPASPGAAVPAPAIATGEILPPPGGAVMQPRSKPPDWVNALALWPTGEPRPVLDNCALALERAPEWRDVIGWDEFGGRIMARRPPPWIKPNGHWLPAAWSDADDLEAVRWVQRAGLFAASLTMHDAIQHVAFAHPFHPVRDYLDGLAWDGKPRLDIWLSYYIGADDSPYARAVGARWLISAVARIFNPGCKVDHILMLVGLQGGQKSTAFRLLADPWFTDDMPDLGTKDAAMVIQGRWVIELSDLESIKRVELNRIKAFISRTTDRFRPPYGRNVIERERQCVFGGSTNEDDPLHDPTGARRFWPVSCTAVDTDALWRDRDQLWAEAVSRFRVGELWYLHEPELVEAAAEHQQERSTEDAWARAVMDWVYAATSEITMPRLLGECLGLRRSEWTRFEQMRVGAILKQHGWKRKQRRASGITYYIYEATVAAPFALVERDELGED